MKTALVFLLLAALSSALPLGFKKGKVYVFKYQAEVVHAIPGGANKQIGVRLRCDCHVNMITAEKAQIKLKNAKVVQLEVLKNEVETPIETVQQAITQLMQHAVKVLFTDGGQVKAVRVSQNDPAWCVNIKLGIANMLQIAPKAEGKKTEQILTSKKPVMTIQKEPAIVGHCTVVYNVIPRANVWQVTKTIRYNHCVARPSIIESIFLGNLCLSCTKSLGYVPYLRHAGQIEAHINSKRFPMKVMSEERHVFTPMSEQGGHVAATVRQHLKFHKRGAPKRAESIKAPADTTLAFKLVHPDDEMRQLQAYKEQIKKMVTNMLTHLQQEAARNIASHKVPLIIADLVAHLRLCDEATLTYAFQKIMLIKNADIKLLGIHALALAGTQEFVTLLKKKHAMLTLPMLGRIMESLIFIPRVMPLHVNTLLDFCENNQMIKSKLWARRQCLLSASVLIFRLSRMPGAMQQTDIRNCLQNAAQMLGDKLKQSTNIEEKLMYLKAAGNAGFLQHQATIVGFLMNRQLQLGFRVECVWALRKTIYHSSIGLHSKLIQLFANPKNHPELRMAVATLVLDKFPSFLNMQLLVNIVQREYQSAGPKSNQVVSWVMSKLFSLAYFDNIISKYRARRARLALRFAPKTWKFGLEYSKAMRIAMFSNKLVSGIEMDINKMNVPRSYIPRNTNARMRWYFMGRSFDLFEVGARVQGLGDVIQDVLSTIRSRQKRSIWESISSFFDSDSSKDRETPTRPSESSSESRDQNPQTDSRSSAPEPSDSEAVAQNTEVSMFMKMFGQEIFYTKATAQTVEDLVGQITNLVIGRKKEIDTALGTMKITKQSIVIEQTFTRAFLVGHARQMVPTLAGLPLHIHLVSSVVANVNNDITITCKPSWFNFLKANSINTNINVAPKFSLFTRAMVVVHNPFVRVGVKLQNFIHMKPNLRLQMVANVGHSYTFTIQNTAQKLTDVLIISPNPDVPEAVGVCGVVHVLNTQSHEMIKKEVALQVLKQNIFKVEKKCYGAAMTGVNACFLGQLPALATLRFMNTHLLTALTQTRLRVQLDPLDTVKQIVLKLNVLKHNKKVMIGHIIYKANGNTKRQVPMTLKFDYIKNQLVLAVSKKAPLTWGMTWRMDFKGLTQIETLLHFFGMKTYKITLNSVINKISGQQLTITLGWNQLPAHWVAFLTEFQPQIMYLLQQFGSVSPLTMNVKKIELIVQLTSPMTANVVAVSPLGKLQANQLALPITISRLPLSLQEILEYPYGQCSIQAAGAPHQQRLSIFDQKSYAISTGTKNTCYHILLQDKQAKMIRIAVQEFKQGQLRLIIKVKQPKQATIIVEHNLAVYIDNKRCKQQACKVKAIGQAIVQKDQVQIQLNLKHYILVKFQQNNIRILASPSLRDRVRGLCGDFNGEDYLEFRNPSGQVVQNINQFARAWRIGC